MAVRVDFREFDAVRTKPVSAEMSVFSYHSEMYVSEYGVSATSIARNNYSGSAIQQNQRHTTELVQGFETPEYPVAE